MTYSDDVTDLISELENKRGGKITWRSMALYYMDTEGTYKEAVFLYMIGDRVWFEDFERQYTFLSFKTAPPKGYKYEKFEGSFLPSEVVEVTKVLKKKAMQFCKGEINSIEPASNICSFLFETVYRLRFRNGESIFLGLINENFEQLFKRS